MEWAAGLMQMASGLMQNRHQDMFNRKAANVAFDRQNMLRNTAHQAEVADLRAAGLNPILSATGGSGAQTPSVNTGAGAVSSSPGVDFAGSSAKEAQVELTKSQDALAKGEITLQGENTDNARRQGKLIDAQTADTAAAAAKKDVETNQLRLLTPGITDKQRAEITALIAQANRDTASAGQAAATTSNLQQQLLSLKEHYKKERTMGKISESDFGKVLNVIEYMSRSAGGAISGAFGK